MVTDAVPCGGITTAARHEDLKLSLGVDRKQGYDTVSMGGQQVIVTDGLRDSFLLYLRRIAAVFLDRRVGM